MKLFLLSIILGLSAVFAYSLAPKTGYRGFVDLNGEALFEKKYSNDRDIVYSVSGVTTTHGYQFNEHFFVGGGIGICFVTYNFEWSSFGIDSPIFVAGRADWRLGKVPLFADVRIGSFLKYWHGYNSDRLFINPSIGYHCSWGRKISLNIGAGLSLHSIDHSGWKMMPSVRIGIEFQ